MATGDERVIQRSFVRLPNGQQAHLVLHWVETRPGQSEVLGLELWTVPPSLISRLPEDAPSERDDVPQLTWPEAPAVVTASLLRRINVGALIEKQRQSAARWTGRLPTITDPELRDFADALKSASPKVGRPPKYGADHYKAVADVYRNAYAMNRKPVQAVARAFAVSPTTATKWVRVARGKYGLLPPTRSGVPSAEQVKEAAE